VKRLARVRRSAKKHVAGIILIALGVGSLTYEKINQHDFDSCITTVLSNNSSGGVVGREVNEFRWQHLDQLFQKLRADTQAQSLADEAAFHLFILHGEARLNRNKLVEVSKKCG
jgi:isopropylmalate/homocitrate/citramalate synthase